MTTSCHFTYYSQDIEQQHPPCSLDKFKIPISLWLVYFPVLVSARGRCYRGFEITSGFRMSLYVTVPQKPCIFHTHTVFHIASIHLHKKVSRGEMEEFISGNACICRKKKYNLILFYNPVFSSYLLFFKLY